jgi:hypothetical protein
MYVFGDKGEKLPAGAIQGFDQLRKSFRGSNKQIEDMKSRMILVSGVVVYNRAFGTTGYSANSIG